MSGPPTTRVSLLLRIRDPQDDAAWRQFVDIYAPLVHGFGCHCGLQEADAADLAQEVLLAVARSAERFHYDPQRGSFHSWLYAITRNKLRDLADRRSREARGSGDTAALVALEQLPGHPTDENEWNRQRQWHLLLWAAEQVKPEFQESTWQAFWQTAIDQLPPAEVAARLGISVGAVYISKSRVLARIRTMIEGIDFQ